MEMIQMSAPHLTCYEDIIKIYLKNGVKSYLNKKMCASVDHHWQYTIGIVWIKATLEMGVWMGEKEITNWNCINVFDGWK